MDRQFTADFAALLGCFDGVNVADHVGDGDIGGGQFFDVAGVAVHPGDRGFVTEGGDLLLGLLGEGGERIIANFGASDVGHLLVEKRREHPDQLCFGLSAGAEQDEVMLGQDGVDDLGDDGILVADDAGKEAFAGANFGDEVLP